MRFLERLRAGKVSGAVPEVDAVACPERDRQQPVPVAQDRGLVQRAAVRDADRGGPDRFIVVGMITADVPIAASTIKISEALIKEAPTLVDETIVRAVKSSRVCRRFNSDLTVFRQIDWRIIFIW